jgi:hypothetical protein
MRNLIRCWIIGWIIKKFREYEVVYTRNRYDSVEWRDEFLLFVYWLYLEKRTIG